MRLLGDFDVMLRAIYPMPTAAELLGPNHAEILQPAALKPPWWRPFARRRWRREYDAARARRTTFAAIKKAEPPPAPRSAWKIRIDGEEYDLEPGEDSEAGAAACLGRWQHRNEMMLAYAPDAAPRLLEVVPPAPEAGKP